MLSAIPSKKFYLWILILFKVETNVEVDTKELIDQCTPFYTSRLKLALAEAF